ncbi:DUF2341 domain-containing protein, partial [Patescibacteria group bacterium]
MRKDLFLKLSLFAVIVFSLFLFDVPAARAGGGSSNLLQYHYNFRTDTDGLNSEASGWLAADDNPASDLVKGTTYRVRFMLYEAGTKKTTETEAFEYGTNSDCTSGSWTPIPGSAALTTEHFVMDTSSQYSDGDLTTTRLLGASAPGTWFDGEGVADPGTVAGPLTYEIGYYTEHEFAFTPTANATNGATYYMRVDSVAGYSVCAQLSLETPAGITVSGGCFTDEGEGTPCTDDGSDQIKVAVNGTPDGGADTTVDGDWLFTINQPSSGDILVFYRDGEAAESEEATTVIKYDGSGDVDNVKMYQSQLVIGADSGSANSDQTIAVTDLDTATNGFENSDDEDVLYDISGSELIVDASANKTEQLYIISGDTYRPASGGGATTTTENLEIDASAVITADSNAFSVSGNWDNNGTFTANTSTITFNAADTGNTIEAGAQTYNNLTFAGSDGAGGWTIQTDDMTVSGTIDVDTGPDILTIASGRILTHTGATMTLDGTIDGAGRLRFTDVSGGPGSGAGTLSAITRYDASAANIPQATIDARTYSNIVEIYSNSASARLATTLGNYTLSGASSHLHVIAAGDGDMTFRMTLDNGDISIGGDLDFTGAGGGSEIIQTGTGTWTVSGSVDLTGGTGTFTSGNTLIMDGTGTLTSDGETLQNLTINSSGAVTLAAATHTVNGNLSLGGSGTPTVTGSTITMTGTSNTITGGDKILNILNINPSSAGTITLQTSNLTVGSTFTVADGDELVIDTVSLTHTDSSDVAGTGTISGSGTLIFDDGSGGPGTTITTYSCVIRFDATAGNVASTTFDARTYNGRVEMYSGAGAGAARSVALANDTYTISGATSHLYIINDNATYTLTLDGALNPTVNIGGDLDFTGGGASSEIITSGTGVWTVGGNVNFTDGTFTATAGNTFRMNGTSKTLTSATQTFQNFGVTGGSITTIDALDVNGTFDVFSGTFVQGDNVDVNVAGNFTLGEGVIFTKAGGTGLLILDGDLTYADNSYDWLANYTYRMKVTFDASELTGSVSSFPVMIHADNSATFTDFWTNLTDTTNGYDVVFTDEDGTTVLDYHLEKFDYGGTDMVAWVEVPTVSNNDIDTIYMYYGRASAPDLSDEYGTYDTDGNFVLVQHLEESPADGNAGHLNSVSASYTGTPQNFSDGGGGTTSESGGKINGADLFAGDDDYVNIPYNAALDPDDITISTWVNFDDLTGSSVTGIISNNNNNDAYNIFLMEGTDRIRIYVKKLAASTCGAGWSCVEYGTNVNTTDWYHIVLTHNSSTGKMEGFINGDSFGSDTVVDSIYRASADVRFGYYVDDYMHGIIDEVTISNTPRTNDWIKLDYLSGSDTLISGWRAEETAPADLQDVGNVHIGTSPDTTDLASDFKANSLTVNSGDIFYTNGYEVDVGNGGITIDGTFNATDDVETDETFIYTAQSFTINAG